MKQKYIVALCVIGIIVGTVFSVRVSDRYQAWSNDRNAKAVASQQAQIAKDQAAAQKVEVTINKYHDNCVMGQKVYDSTTLAERAVNAKKGIVRPICE